MPTIKTVSVAYERKINPRRLDQNLEYESTVFQFSLWADVDQEEDVQAVTAELQEFCRKAVNDEISKYAIRVRDSKDAFRNVVPMLVVSEWLFMYMGQLIERGLLPHDFDTEMFVNDVCTSINSGAAGKDAAR